MKNISKRKRTDDKDNTQKCECPPATPVETKPEDSSVWVRLFDHLCDAIDEWRIVPRIVVVMYTWMFYQTTMWFMGLAAPTPEQSAFIATIVGGAAAFFGIYTSGGGRDNHDKE